MKQPRTATLIYNPQAGPASIRTAVTLAASFWEQAGWKVTVKPTRYAGHAKELAREAVKDRQHLVLATGGDGTLGEVARGLIDSDVVMAPLPTGTGNSFAKELRLPRLGALNRNGLLQASRALIGGRVQRIDMGSCEDQEYWLLWLGTGVDGFVVKHIEPRSKLAKKFGSIGYVGEGIPVLRHFPGMSAVVQVDDRRFSGDFLMITVSNCRRFGGGDFVLNPGAILDDGQFEVWMFRGRSRLQVFRHMFDIGFGRHLRDPNVESARGRQVMIATEPTMPVHHDGDPAGNTPVFCTVKSRALRVLVPDSAPDELFQERGEPLFET